MEKYRVTLTADERSTLEKLVSVGRAAARKLTHARILLLADTSHELEYRDDQIVLALGTSLRSVERIRKRFVTEGIATAINPKLQPPRPDKIKIKGGYRAALGALGV
jgi:Winged helix-turn helix